MGTIGKMICIFKTLLVADLHVITPQNVLVTMSLCHSI